MAISRDLLYSKDQMNKSMSRNMNNEISKYYYKAAKLFPKDFNPKCIEMKFIIPNEDNEDEEVETAEKKPKRKYTRKQTGIKNNVEPKNSKEAITNYLKPDSRRSKKSLEAKNNESMKVEDVPEVIPQIEEVEDFINLDEIDDPQEVLNDPLKPANRDINYNEVLDKYKASVNELIEANGIKEGSVLKVFIDQHAEKEINTFMNLLTFFNEPVKEKTEKFVLDPGDIDLTLMEPDESTDQKIIERNERLKQNKKTKFMPVISKFNESNDILKSPEKSPELKPQEFNFNSPLPIKFQDLRNSSTPIISRHFSPRISTISPRLQNFANKFSPKPASPLVRQSTNLQKTVEQPQKDASKPAIQNELKVSVNDDIKKKFDFLGIMSIEDIFEGCDSQMDYNNISKWTENASKCTENIQKSPNKDEVIYSSDDEPTANNILKKFNIRNINDLFDSSNEDKSLKDMEGDIFLNDEEALSLESDKTQVYDVDEEVARIEESNRLLDESRLFLPAKMEFSDDEVIESSQKENFIQPTTSHDDSFLKKTTSKPNLSKLMQSFQSNSILTAKAQDNQSLLISQIPTQKVSTQIRFKTPPPQEITIRSNESTPELSNKSSFYQKNQAASPITSRPIDNHLETIKANFKTPPVRRRNLRRKKMPHSSFLQTQAGVDDHYASSDEQDEILDTSLNEFVCNESVPHDDTMMHARYLKSLQSPSAARNGRFVLRQLQPANLSDIYSQMPHEDDTYDDSDNSMDSFIVDGEDESVESEIDELELAEKMLIEKRRKRKLKQNNGEQRKKRKIVVADSESSDGSDELEKLRNEVLANPD